MANFINKTKNFKTYQIYKVLIPMIQLVEEITMYFVDIIVLYNLIILMAYGIEVHLYY